jgi:segregation and condensation protein B
MILENQIEAVLFVKGEPVSLYELARILETEVEKVDEAAFRLAERLSRGGMRLMRNDYFVELRTAPECSELIQKLLKEDVDRDLTKAALETLSIVLYQGPVSAAEIDFVRGVNSRNTLRSLSARGLIEREHDEGASRYVYKPSLELLSYIGVAGSEEIPQYAEIRDKMNKFLQETRE